MTQSEELERRAAVMSHYANGGKVDVQNRDIGGWRQLPALAWPSWNWVKYDYRISKVQP